MLHLAFGFDLTLYHSVESDLADSCRNAKLARGWIMAITFHSLAYVGGSAYAALLIAVESHLAEVSAAFSPASFDYGFNFTLCRTESK
jgi:hypothetical protein